MADEETRPLLFHADPSWTGRLDASSPISSNTNVSSNSQGNYNRAPVSEREKAVGIRNNWQVKGALASILLAVVLERLSFYGLTGNLVLFLNEKPFNWESYHAISASFMFFGISYVMSLVGGWISDSLLGRFKTIILAYGIYLGGYALLPFIAIRKLDNSTVGMLLPEICLSSKEAVASDDPFQEPCAWLIFVTLVIIAAAAGILKANICPFGADQLVQASQQTQLSFFNLFYWCINVGSFIGLGVIAYVEQEKSFLTGFIIGAVTLSCSAIVFIAGRCCYICRPGDGSVLTNIFKIFREAWRNRSQQRHLLHSLKKGVTEGPHVDEAQPENGKISFLDYAKHCHGGIFHSSLVDDVKKLGMILAVFAVLIPYWLVYFQMQTTFLVQALHMKLNLLSVNWTIEAANIISNKSFPAYTVIPSTGSKFTFVAAWFSLFDAFIVIILLPLFDRVIYPRMARAGYPFTFGKRIVLGMLFAVASMVVAGIVEHNRLKAYWPEGNTCESRPIEQQIGDTLYYAADMSVLWQIPQYTLIGISEVFASVASLQFAVTLAPKSMKAVVTGLFYFISGIASILGIAFVLILASTNTWFQSGDSGNINCRSNCSTAGSSSTGSCQLDYYFYSLAGWETFGLILFLVVARVFRLNTDESEVYLRRKVNGRGSRNRHIQSQISSQPATPS